MFFTTILTRGRKFVCVGGGGAGAGRSRHRRPGLQNRLGVTDSQVIRDPGAGQFKENAIYAFMDRTSCLDDST